jgi:hypothetical protein
MVESGGLRRQLQADSEVRRLSSVHPGPMPARTVIAATTVKPASLSIGTLLEDRSPFYVPRYQRAYAWEDDEVDDFVRDLRDLWGGASRSPSHFFGGMVAIETTEHAKEARALSHEVVDGQQRLATFCLTLARIESAAAVLSSAAQAVGETGTARSLGTFAKETRERYLYYRRYDIDRGKEYDAPRLRLSRGDDDKFQALLAGNTFNNSRDSHRLLDEANEQVDADLIRPIIAAADTTKDKLKALRRLRAACVDDSFVIHIVCSDKRSGYQLFSVLNDRGEALSDADLLRSLTLEHLERFDRIQEETAGIWDELLASPAADVRAFLKAYYPSKTGERSHKGLFDDIADRFFPQSAKNTAEASQIRDAVAELREEFETFTDLTNGDWPYPASPAASGWQRDRLRRLVVVLKHELALPLLLAAARTGNDKDFAELVWILEVFAFRYKNICGGHASRPGREYYAEAKALREQSGKPHTWHRLRTALRLMITSVADNVRFQEDLKDKLQYNYRSQRAHISELLTTLESFGPWLRGGASGSPKWSALAVFDLAAADLEHIYPQNPVSADAALEPLKNCLGNLTFWDKGDNRTAGNAPFAKKKSIYARSNVVLTSALGKLTNWTSVDLNKREKELLEDALKVFRL